MPKPIILVGEAWGQEEARSQTPFCGSSGIELLRMLNEAGIIELTSEDFSFISKFYSGGGPLMIDMIWKLHPEVYRTNVFQFHPPGNDISFVCGPKAEGIIGYPALLKSKYVRREFIHELERLGDEILTQDPNLILALGNTALWALAGTTNISKLRGSTRLTTHTATGFKLLPTYHPAAILRQWANRPVVIADLFKARREAEFGEIRRPKRIIWIEPTLEDIKVFYEQHIKTSKRLSVDIETAGNQITCIGFAPTSELSIVIPIYDGRRKNRSYWPTKEVESQVWSIIKSILEDRTISKVFQNGLYDIAFNFRSMGLPTYGADEDTMLLHHALQPESLKALGFLGSIYTDEGSWKHDRKATTTIKRDE